MIPLLIKIQIRGRNQKHRKIWIPLPLVYIPVLIIMIIISPLLIIGSIALLIIKGTNMFKAIPALYLMLTASSGFLIDVNSQKGKFLIAIK
ncbi:MAG: hypothetical protein P8185_12725 [Deltaproteobacteria bacterium]|jgi:hypothetical protein